MMEPRTSRERAFQEWACERGTDSEDATGEHGACPHPRGKILPGDEFLLVELPGGRVMRYHPECVPAGLREKI